jgi:hypothetical protein
MLAADSTAAGQTKNFEFFVSVCKKPDQNPAFLFVPPGADAPQPARQGLDVRPGREE